MQKYKYSKFSIAILAICSVIFICGTASIFFAREDIDIPTRAFQMFETALMILLVHFPMLISRYAHIEMTPSMEFAFLTFCFASLILGDVVNLYSRFEWWDTALHGLSGFLLARFAYDSIVLYYRDQPELLYGKALSVALLTFCFSVTVGALWEMMEFVTDGIFGLNSQEYFASSGTFNMVTPRVGREALRDTMIDMILNFGGAAVMAVVCFFKLRKEYKNNKPQYIAEVK